MQFKKKLFIGTAQFLSNYGITNNIYTDKKYCLNLLEHAAKKGIMNYDTAVGYKSEKLMFGNKNNSVLFVKSSSF